MSKYAASHLQGCDPGATAEPRLPRPLGSRITQPKICRQQQSRPPAKAIGGAARTCKRLTFRSRSSTDGRPLFSCLPPDPFCRRRPLSASFRGPRSCCAWPAPAASRCWSAPRRPTTGPPSWWQSRWVTQVIGLIAFAQRAIHCFSYKQALLSCCEAAAHGTRPSAPCD